MNFVLGVIVAAAITWLVAIQVNNTIQFNRWTAACNKAGGQISQTHAGLFSKRYECFVNGNIEKLPGWGGK